MSSVSRRAIAGLSCLAFTAASCGSVESVSGPSVDESSTTAPDQVALDDSGEQGDDPTTTVDADDDVDATETTEADQTVDATETTEPTGTSAVETTVEETTTSAAPAETTTAPPAPTRSPAERILSTADVEAAGLVVETSWSVSEDAASQDRTCGIPDPIADGRVVQVFQSTGGTLIAQYVQEGEQAADQWMASLAALDGCTEAGVSPMRVGVGDAEGADQTVVLDSNGSDDDGGYMTVLGARKGDTVTGFFVTSTDADHPALQSTALLSLLEIAIAN